MTRARGSNRGPDGSTKTEKKVTLKKRSHNPMKRADDWRALDGQPPVIDNDLDLFLWLFEQLDQSQPRVPVRDHVRAGIDHFYETMKTSRVTNDTPAYFREIFTETCWSNMPEDTPRCGLKLLRFIGQLSAEINKHDYVRVSRLLLAEIMLEDADLYEYGVRYVDKGLRLRSTAAFTRRFGVQINVIVPDRGDMIGSMWEFIEPRLDEFR